MLYPHPYVRPSKEWFGSDQDGFRLRDRWCAGRARHGPVFPLPRSSVYARLGPRRNSSVQDEAGPCCFPVTGHTGCPQGAPLTPRPRGALQVAATSRRRPGRDGGRRYGRSHPVPDDRLAGDASRRDSPRLRRGGGPEDRLLRQRGPHGDPAGTQGEGASPERVRDLPPPARVGAVEATLQPPTVRDLGRSMANFVLRAVLLGTVGGLVGVLRGRPSLPEGEKLNRAPRRE